MITSITCKTVQIITKQILKKIKNKTCNMIWKSKNNIEGTVDKTSLKCKGVWIWSVSFSSVFPLQNHPRFFFFLNFVPLSPSLPAVSPPLPPSLCPSVYQTSSIIIRVKRIHWFKRFLSFSSKRGYLASGAFFSLI